PSDSDLVYPDDYPAVVRPNSHLGGRNLILVNNRTELVNAIRQIGSSGYISKYIPKIEEYRVFVANGRVAYVIKKIVDNPNAVAWNVAQGGRFENVRFGSWNLKVVKHAVDAFNLTDLDFGAVDVIVDASNNVYVLE